MLCSVSRQYTTMMMEGGIRMPSVPPAAIDPAASFSL